MYGCASGYKDLFPILVKSSLYYSKKRSTYVFKGIRCLLKGKLEVEVLGCNGHHCFYYKKRL